MEFSNENNTTWATTSQTMPTKSAGIAAVALPQKNRAAAIGSYDLCHTFNAEEQTWQKLPPMRERRFYCGAVIHQNRLFAMGGMDMNKHWLDSMEMLPFDSEGNPSQEGWQQMPSMSTKRDGFGAATINNIIYVVGGHSGTRNLKAAEAFDLKENRWVSLPDMMERRNGCAVVSVKGRLFVFGGDHGEERLDTAEVFDTKTNIWSSLPNMPRARVSLAAVVVGEMIFILGGQVNSNFPPQEVDIFDTSTMQWLQSSLPRISTGRYACGAVYTQGKILVFGGGVQNKIINTIEMIEAKAPPDYSEFKTRTGLVAEIRKLEEAALEDESTPQANEEQQEKLSRLEELLSRMPTAEDLEVSIFNLTNKIKKLQVKEKELMEQLKREVKAADELKREPWADPVSSASTRKRAREDDEQQEDDGASHPTRFSPRPQLSPMSEEKDNSSQKPPHRLICPISRELMNDPVVAADGHSYDRSFIQQWFATQEKSHVRSPLTGAILDDRRLVPNIAIRSQIREYQQQQQQQDQL